MRLDTATATTTLLLAVLALWPAGGWTTAQCAFKDQRGAAGSLDCKQECLAAPRRDDVFGTDTYHEDSNVCRAALHAGYLLPGGGSVNYRLQPSTSSENTYTGTVRNRIKSVSGSKPGKLYSFTGTKPVPASHSKGWTMLVHDSYNSGGVLHVSCLGSGSTSFASWSHSPIKKGIVQEKGIKQLTRKRDENAHAFVCQGDEPGQDSTAAITFRDAWYQTATPSFTASVGENFTVTLKKARTNLPDNVFLRRLPDGWNYAEGESAVEPLELEFPSAAAEEAGIYIVGNTKTGGPWGGKPRQDAQIQGAYFTLIVRDCPDQRWGPECSQWCPDCRNGGQCHPLTGNCICPPGFYGPDCSQACPPEFLGPACKQECSPYFRGEKPSPVEDSSCKGLTVCLPYPYGCSCVAGYHGPQCDEACPDGHYGAGCTLTCSYCVDRKCEGNSGRCLDGCVDEVACDSSNFPLNLPHVTEPLQVKISSPSTASVNFDLGRSQRRAGTPRVKGYVVQHMRQNQDVWESVNVSEEEFRKNKSLTVPNLVPGYKYRLRVLVDTEEGMDTGRTHSRILKESFEMPCRDFKSPNMTVLERTSTSAIIQLSSSKEENFEKCNTVMDAWLDDTTKLAEGKAPSIELTELQGDTRYDITVMVSNINGKSQVQVSFFTLPEAPEPPTKLFLEAGQTNITVNFDEPEGNITDYMLEFRTMDTDLCPGELHPSIRFKEPPYMITQVQAFRAYNICVSATFKGAQGDQTCATVITKSGTPTVAPKLMHCESNTTKITCRTDLTEICGGLGGEHISVEMKAEGRSPCTSHGWNNTIRMTQGERWTFTGTVEDLDPNVGYGVTARVLNEAGEGRFTAMPHILKTLPSVPETPTLGNVITASPNSLLLLWDDPCPDSDDKVIRYQLIYKDVQDIKENVTDIQKENECQDNKYQHCYHLDNLETGLTYSLQIVAINSLGRSPRSDSKRGTTMESKSEAPDITVEQRATALQVTLHRPEQTNGRLTRCRVQIFNGNKTCEIEPKFMSSVLGECNIAGLESGKFYDVSAQCYNSVGWGNRLNMTYPTLPSKPQLRGRVLLLPHTLTKTSFSISLPKVHRTGEKVSTLSIMTVKMGKDEKYSSKNFTSIYFELRSLQSGPRVRRAPTSPPSTCGDQSLKRIVGNFIEPFIPSEYMVGDGKTYNGYVNCELTTGQRYLVGVVACTSLEGKLNCTEAQLSHFVLVVENSMSHTLAIAISVILVVIVLSIFIGVLCTLRKRKSYSGTSTFKKEEDNIAVDLAE